MAVIGLPDYQYSNPGLDNVAKLSNIFNAQQQREESAQRVEESKIDTKIKQAEYDDSLSDLSKELKEAKKRTELATKNAERIKQEAILENPGLVRDLYKSGALAQYNENLKKANADKLELFSDVAGDFDGSPEQYTQVFSRLLAMDPDLVDELPSPEEYSSDPTKKTLARVLISAAIGSTAQKRKERQVGIEHGLTMERVRYQEGKEDARLNTREAGENTRLDKTITAQAERNRETIQGRIDVAAKQAQAKIDAAKEKAKKEGRAVKIRDVIGTDTTTWMRYDVASMVTGVLDNNDIKLDPKQKNQLIADAAGYANTAFNKAAQAGEEFEHPDVLARNYIEMQLRDGNIAPGTNFFRKGTYEPDYKGGEKPRPKTIEEALDPKKDPLNAQRLEAYKKASPETQAKVRKSLGLE